MSEIMVRAPGVGLDKDTWSTRQNNSLHDSIPSLSGKFIHDFPLFFSQ
jgi:hypothetical protein